MKKFCFVVSLVLSVACLADGSGAVCNGVINPLFKKWAKCRSSEATNGSPKAQVMLSTKTLLQASESPQGEIRSADGVIPSEHDLTYLTTCNQGGVMDLSISRVEKLGVKYDLRDDGLVSSVKDQGRTGTCWAHASCAALESWILKVTNGVELDLSENNLANLAGWDMGYNDGGNADMATGYFTRWSGPVLEIDDPFGTTGKGRPGDSVEMTPRYHIQQTRIIAARNYEDNTAGTHIKRAVLTYGALYVSYWHCQYRCSKKYDYYLTEDAFNACYESKRKYGKNSQHSECGGHAVTLIGWDDEYPKEKFKTQPPGDGAYLVKNSWGTDIGDKGCMYISYYDALIVRPGCELYAFPGAEPADNYSKLYQYDPYGWSGGTEKINDNEYLLVDFPCRTSKAYGANIFTASANDDIVAIGFFSRAPDTTVTIAIYTNLVSAVDPCSGSLAYCRSYTADSAGYYTVQLENSVSVQNARRFSVVLCVDAPNAYDGNNDRYYPLAFEMKGMLNSNATASAGQSYCSLDGESWCDVYKYFAESRFNANFCVKAYAAVKAPAKSLICISCHSSDDSANVASGKTKQFICKATYSDRSTPTVTPIWEITSGKAYGSISASGLFTAAKVTSEQEVGVKASYTESGVTKTNGFVVTITVAAPTVPTGLTATKGTESACTRLSWTASDGATAYAIYRAKGSDKAFSAASYYDDAVGQTKFADKNATPGVDYTYFVKAKNGSGTSDPSLGVNGWRALAAPETVLASDGTSTEYVRITWSEVKGAGAYRVYRSETDDEDDAAPLGTGWQTVVGFDDKTATPGVVYYYWVKAAVDTKGARPSALGVGDSGLRKKEIVPEKLLISGEASVASGGKKTYTAKLCFTDGGEHPVTPKWTLNGSTKTVASYVYTAPVVSTSTKVSLGASFTTNGVPYTATQEITVTPTVTGAPAAPTVTGQSTSGISLSWTAVAGASSYVIYRGATTDAASAKEIGTATGTSYDDGKVTPGQTVYYFIATVNAAGTSARSAASAAALRSLIAPVRVMASNGTYSDKVRVTWAPVPGASHYRVSRATSKTGDQTDLGDEWVTGTTFDDETAEAGTTYWYFVRAATSSAGANVSAKSDGATGHRKVVVVPTGLSITGPDRVNASGKAVYAAVATFSVGDPATVAASWEIKAGSGASIASDGTLTADAVTTDTSVEIKASYTANGEPVNATKTVRIIAPRPATVSVSKVKATSRWPWCGIIDIDYTIETDPEGKRASVSVSGFDNDHQKPVAASTLTGDGAEGPVAAGDHRVSWNLAADHPGFNAASFSVDITASIVSIEAPTGLTASNGTSADAVELGWNAVDDAESYQVWRGTDGSGSDMEKIATVTGTTYADTNATPLVTYYYWVAASDSFGTCEWNETAISGIRNLAAPTNVSATDGTYSDRVVVSWTASPQTTSYEVWRYTSNQSGSAEKIGTATTTSYDDTKAVAGTTYYYWVKAVGGSGTSDFSVADSGSRKKIATGLVITGESSVKAGGTATYTCTASYNDNTTAPVTPTWTISAGSSYGNITSAGVLSANGTSVARSVTLKASYSYNGETVFEKKTISITTFTVSIAFSGNGGTPSVSSKTYTAYATYGTLPTATLANHTFLGWFTAVSGGTQVTTASTVPTTGTTLHAHWQLSVPPAPTNVTATDGTSHDNVTITWTASSLATSYEIWRCTSNVSGSATKIGTSSTTSYSDSTAVAGTTYYYWVKAVGSGGTSGSSVSDSGFRLIQGTYKLTFNRQGGSGGTDYIIATNGFMIPKITSPTRAGYGFGGYFTSKSFGGTQYYASTCTGLVSNVSASRTLYAGWIQNISNLTATVESNGVRLTWDASEGATKYRVWVFRASYTQLMLWNLRQSMVKESSKIPELYGSGAGQDVGSCQCFCEGDYSASNLYNIFVVQPVRSELSFGYYSWRVIVPE